MLSNSDVLMANVLHEAQVREATAHSEHRLAARLAAQEKSRAAQPAANGWKVWKKLGASRGGRNAR